MPRLLIQCQGSPGPLSFKVSEYQVMTILKQYHRVPGQTAIVLESDIAGHYHINLSMISWMCVIGEPEVEPVVPDSEDIIPF